MNKFTVDAMPQSEAPTTNGFTIDVIAQPPKQPTTALGKASRWAGEKTREAISNVPYLAERGLEEGAGLATGGTPAAGAVGLGGALVKGLYNVLPQHARERIDMLGGGQNTGQTLEEKIPSWRDIQQYFPTPQSTLKNLENFINQANSAYKVLPGAEKPAESHISEYGKYLPNIPLYGAMPEQIKQEVSEPLKEKLDIKEIFEPTGKWAEKAGDVAADFVLMMSNPLKMTKQKLVTTFGKSVAGNAAKTLAEELGQGPNVAEGIKLGTYMAFGAAENAFKVNPVKEQKYKAWDEARKNVQIKMPLLLQ